MGHAKLGLDLSSSPIWYLVFIHCFCVGLWCSCCATGNIEMIYLHNFSGPASPNPVCIAERHPCPMNVWHSFISFLHVSTDEIQTFGSRTLHSFDAHLTLYGAHKLVFFYTCVCLCMRARVCWCWSCWCWNHLRYVSVLCLCVQPMWIPLQSPAVSKGTKAEGSKRDYIAELFKDWSPDIHKVLDATLEEEIEQRDLYDRPPEIFRSWSEGDVTMLGLLGQECDAGCVCRQRCPCQLQRGMTMV